MYNPRAAWLDKTFRICDSATVWLVERELHAIAYPRLPASTHFSSVETLRIADVILSARLRLKAITFDTRRSHFWGGLKSAKLVRLARTNLLHHI